MRNLKSTLFSALFVFSCGGGSSRPTVEAPAVEQEMPRDEVSDTQGEAESAPEANADEPLGKSGDEFRIQDSKTAGDARGVEPSTLKPSETMAVMKFFVIDKSVNKPIKGVVISLKGEAEKKYYTPETDALGYAEVLVPVGQSYDISYLSLSKNSITATAAVSDKPMQNIKLTLRYTPYVSKDGVSSKGDAGTVFRLDGVTFRSGSASLLPESAARLDGVIEYLERKPDVKIEISGHTDSAGSAKSNMALSMKRAESCRTYFLKNGISAKRVLAVGYGGTKPVADNNTPEGQKKNRRIEVRQLD